MSSGPWHAPFAHAPVRADVSLPGSKSLTNRALVLAALSDGPSVVRSALRSRDTALMAAGLAAMGVGVADDGDDWKITHQHNSVPFMMDGSFKAAIDLKP